MAIVRCNHCGSATKVFNGNELYSSSSKYYWLFKGCKNCNHIKTIDEKIESYKHKIRNYETLIDKTSEMKQLLKKYINVKLPKSEITKEINRVLEDVDIVLDWSDVFEYIVPCFTDYDTDYTQKVQMHTIKEVFGDENIEEQLDFITSLINRLNINIRKLNKTKELVEDFKKDKIVWYMFNDNDELIVSTNI